ncbi:hypothetical protein BVC80_7875g4 [Macleaya cordata]|uniref:RNase H type-1 domain-containing protein n=1 Tax=Macleaya cordata TaxID=56857 RepID=A0A200PT03_MACCD|nr:hypothetical protein BVC80_7875g4 [Macleaya cordata]
MASLGLGISAVSFQLDSALVIKWLRGSSLVPWSLCSWWQDIRENMDLLVSKDRIYREANAAADYMASLGLQF